MGGNFMIYDVLGWVGMILVLLAYGLLSLNKIIAGKIYQTLNLIAALLMAVGLFPKNAWFSFALQIIWALVAFFALIKLARDKKNTKDIIKK